MIQKRHLTPIFLGVYLAIELAYNIVYLLSLEPQPFLVDLEFLFLILAVVCINHKNQAKYFMPLVPYYMYTAITQYLIALNLYPQESIFLIDIAFFLGCNIALLLTILRVKNI